MKLLSLILFIMFLGWTMQVVKGKTKKIDNKVYNQMNIRDVKTKFFKIITSLGSTMYFVIVCILAVVFLEIRLAFWIIVAMIIDSVIIGLFKNTIKRERPNIKRLVVEKGYSYPSGHTFSATCFYGLIIFLIWTNPLIVGFRVFFTLILGILVLLIGYSRIYLGVHYFSDVVGALLIGSSYVLLYIYFTYVVLKLV